MGVEVPVSTLIGGDVGAMLGKIAIGRSLADTSVERNGTAERANSRSGVGTRPCGSNSDITTEAGPSTSCSGSPAAKAGVLSLGKFEVPACE